MRKSNFPFVNKGIQKFNSLKIRNKIIIFYFSLIVFSILLSVFIYMQTSSAYLKKTIRDLNLNEIKSDNKSLELLLEDVSNYSKELLANEWVQEVLDTRTPNNAQYRNLNQDLAKSINFNSKISSVYVFNNEGKKYYAEKVTVKKIQLSDIQSKDWYSEVVKKRGGFYYNFNADGLLIGERGNYLTFFRIINSNNDIQPIGVMMINIEEAVVRNTLNIQDDTNLSIIFEELKNHTRMEINPMEGFIYSDYEDKIVPEKPFIGQETVNGTNMVITGLVNEKYDWKLLRAIPNQGQAKMAATFNVAVLAIILINGVLIIFGSFFIARYITNPIRELMDSMKDVETGNFYPVEVPTHHDEIGRLKEGYNFMIIKIQELLQTVVEEQKTLKKAELRVIMEQIKPHFMYNTLDSISSLVMLDRKEDAYESLRALGKFYRSSLSDGRFIVSIETELDIIRNYLFIQKIRYQELFEVTYDIDETLLDFKVPKLILQPLVENSIYHGLRPLGEDGKIIITVKKDQGQVVLSVEDTGCGMSNLTIESLKSTADSSVGVPATMKRVHNMYGDQSEFKIESTQQGTTVTIRLPMEGEVNDHEQI